MNFAPTGTGLRALNQPAQGHALGFRTTTRQALKGRHQL